MLMTLNDRLHHQEPAEDGSGVDHPLAVGSHSDVGEPLVELDEDGVLADDSGISLPRKTTARSVDVSRPPGGKYRKARVARFLVRADTGVGGHVHTDKADSDGFDQLPQPFSIRFPSDRTP